MKLGRGPSFLVQVQRTFSFLGANNQSFFKRLLRRDAGRTGDRSADHAERRVCSFPLPAPVRLREHGLPSAHSPCCCHPLRDSDPRLPRLGTSGQLPRDESGRKGLRCPVGFIVLRIPEIPRDIVLPLDSKCMSFVKRRFINISVQLCMQLESPTRYCGLIIIISYILKHGFYLVAYNLLLFLFCNILTVKIGKNEDER